MNERPETEYAWNGDVSLAYQVVGEGPVDVLLVPGWFSNLDLQWESPYLARFLERLSQQARLIITDRRGWGLSERFSPSDVPPLEALADDLGVVLDAANSERAVVATADDTGLIAQFFAAAHPERVAGLILIDSYVSYRATEETPWMPDRAWWEEFNQSIRDSWGRRSWESGPDLGGPAEREWFLRMQRNCNAPGANVAEIRRFVDTSTADVLPAIRVPTLVLADSDNHGGSFEMQTARYLADRIPVARLVEYSGGGGFFWYAPAETILREIGSFLATLHAEQAVFDRVLATVLFTDIVGSTERAANIGDAAWKALLARHHEVVRALISRYRGTEVDTAGDGFFATFDGPARAIHCATSIADAVHDLGLEIRAGLHTGECELMDGKVEGIAVHVGARVAALAGPSEVLVSSTVKDLVAGSGLSFEDAGEHALKGVPDTWHLYRVVST